MFQMANRIHNSNIIPPEQSPSLIPIRAVPYTNFPNSDMNPLNPQNTVHRPELERREELQQTGQWMDFKRYAEHRTFPSEIQKRQWIAQAEQHEKEYQARKHMEMEQDPYYRANQEYMRLMNENHSRQSFREKQRLTEDLEKQKRLLIEDLARDQQLLQNKYKRNASVENSHSKKFIADNQYRRELPPQVRRMSGPPDRGNIQAFTVSAHPFAQNIGDPRYLHPFQHPGEIFSPRRMSDNILHSKDSMLHTNQKERNVIDMMKQQQCKHSDHPQSSLLPLIQEKERKIKEMEERIIKLTQANHENAREQEKELEKRIKTSLKASHQIKKDNISPTQMSPSVNNEASSPTHTVDNLIIDVTDEIDEKPAKEEPVDVSDQISINGLNKSCLTGPTESSSNSMTEVVALTDKNDNQIKVSIGVNNNSIENQEDEEKVVLCDNKNPHIEEIVYIKDELVKSKSSSDSDLTDSVKSSKKKQKQKNVNKSTEPDFKASQSRLALDLPNHNWLVERLMQQNKLGENDVVTKTGSKIITRKDSQPNDLYKQDVQEQVAVELKKDKLKKPMDKQRRTEDPEDKVDEKNKIDELDCLDKPEEEKKLDQSDNQDDKAEISKSEISYDENLNDCKQEVSRHRDSGIGEIQILSVMSLKNTQEKVMKDSYDNIIEEISSNEMKHVTDNKVPSNINPVVLVTDVKSNVHNKQINDNISNGLNINSTNKQGNINNQIDIKKSSDLTHSTLLLKMLDTKKTNPQLTSPNRINPPEVSVNYKPILPKTSQIINSRPPTLIKSNTVSSESDVSVNTVNNLSSENKTALRTDRLSEPPSLTTVSGLSTKQEPLHLQSLSAPPTAKPNYYEPPSSFPRRANSENGNRPSSTYHDIRPNLVVMTRKESDSQYSYPNLKYQNPEYEASNYNKLVIEERYNRKRSHEEEMKSFHPRNVDQGISIAEIENNAKMRRLALMQQRNEDPRLISVSQLDNQHRLLNLEETQFRDEARAVAFERQYMSLRQDPRHQLSIRPTQLDAVNQKSLGPHNAATSSDLIDAQAHYSRVRRSPSAFIHPNIAERGLEKQIHPFERIGSHIGRERTIIDAKYKSEMEQRRHENAVYGHMYERDRRIIEEARRKEEIQRAEAAMLQNKYTLSVEHKERLNGFNKDPIINDRVRTVEDLRYAQMGLPVDSPYRHPNRQTRVFRNDRLTEREKSALREAELNNNTSIKHDSALNRHNIHSAYLEQARLEHNIPDTAMTVPIQIINAPPLNSEEIKLAEFKKKEEFEKLRLYGNPARLPEDLRESIPLIPNHDQQNRIDQNGPPFYSHKIPRTRNGSLDFGRSKRVDYSFLDYSPNLQQGDIIRTFRGDTIPNESLKRPNSATVGNHGNKIARRMSPPQPYVSSGLYKRLSDEETKQGRGERPNTLTEKWKGKDSTEKRFCKICNTDAQYLCSGCRKAWYCSQSCQLSEWKVHSKTCVLER